MGPKPRSSARLFIRYALASLIPVLVLGVVLATSFRAETNAHAVSEARSQARLIAQTAIDPVLRSASLRHGVDHRERAELRRLSREVIGRGDVLRLRVRDLHGNIVFSNDGSGHDGPPDHAALTAASGRALALLTHLNADSADKYRSGTEAVEVYLPLERAHNAKRVGVLEIYLPYAPISRDVTSGLHRLYLELVIGLLVLYLVLFAITLSVGGVLRREAAINRFLAEHDVLTELPNRSLFRRRTASAIDAAARYSHPVAMAIVDLDRFKDVNDTLGHHSGDHLLTEIARRLAAQMRPGDTVARLGGDEFGLLVRNLEEPETVLWRLLEVIDREVEVSGLPVTVQASLGYVCAPDDGTNVDELMQRADVAMYAAKSQHLGLVRYDPSLDHYDAASLALVSELRRGIDNNELVLHYQPQADPRDGAVRAVETLIRWEHPDHGLLMPGQFLPLAEQTDVIDKLTTWVLRRALADLHPLLAAGELSVAVNVSARTIGRQSFAAEVIRLLHELRLPGDRLTVEVTETALMADPDRAGLVLSRLAKSGISISLDDFGSGQTSLGYLSALPLDELKIDRDFVTDMLQDHSHAAIVRSILELGHNLGLQVVAEGVETDPVRRSLAASGVDLIQGYFLARPMARNGLVAWLRARGGAQDMPLAAPAAPGVPIGPMAVPGMPSIALPAAAPVD
jgi:diguanylate cyclase (GGDEF)-like protein